MNISNYYRDILHFYFSLSLLNLGVTVPVEGFLWWLSCKESAWQCRRCRLDPWVGKIPWGRKWQPTPVLFLGESNGQRSLVGYSPWGHKESVTTATKPPTPPHWQRTVLDGTNMADSLMVTYIPQQISVCWLGMGFDECPMGLVEKNANYWKFSMCTRIYWVVISSYDHMHWCSLTSELCFFFPV